MGGYQSSERQLLRSLEKKMEDNLGDEIKNTKNEKRQSKRGFEY
jgi:hypothetical protein